MYGIHRVERRKRQDVGGLQAEANRDAEHQKNFAGSDIDWERTRENDRLISNDAWLDKIKSKIDEAGITNVRKDAVMMLDGLYTASPEFFEGKSKQEIRQFFDECLQFHIDHYCHGDKSLMINAIIHYDETTPHLQVASVPLTEDGRLCAKDIMGQKKDYTARQNAFYEEVTKNHGLERGEVHENGEKRKHITQMEHKEQQAKEDLKDAKKELRQSKLDLERVRKRLDDNKQKRVEEGRRAEELKEKNEAAQKQLERTLNWKKMAVGVKRTGKETVSMNKNAYEALENLGIEVRDSLREETRRASENIERKRKLDRKEKALDKREQEIEPLAKQYEDKLAELDRDISEQAQKRVEKAFNRTPTDYTKRLEDFISRLSSGGRNLFDIFKEQEQKLKEKVQNLLESDLVR